MLFERFENDFYIMLITCMISLFLVRISGCLPKLASDMEPIYIEPKGLNQCFRLTIDAYKEEKEQEPIHYMLDIVGIILV